jgi:hypothetical protein
MIVGMGMLSAACSVSAKLEPARPAESGSAPSRTMDLSTLPAPAPGVSWLRVSPEQGAPGAAVSLDVACLDSLGTVHSPVLGIGALKASPEGHQPWHLTGPATVRPDAKPGRYPVSVMCGAGALSATFSVVAAS